MTSYITWLPADLAVFQILLYSFPEALSPSIWMQRPFAFYSYYKAHNCNVSRGGDEPWETAEMGQNISLQ